MAQNTRSTTTSIGITRPGGICCIFARARIREEFDFRLQSHVASSNSKFRRPRETPGILDSSRRNSVHRRKRSLEFETFLHRAIRCTRAVRSFDRDESSSGTVTSLNYDSRSDVPLLATSRVLLPSNGQFGRMRRERGKKGSCFR